MPTPDQKDEALDSSWPESTGDGEGADTSAVREKEGNGSTADVAPEADADPSEPVYDEARAAKAGEIRIEIEGRDSGRIIGKKGQVLAAIQHVVNRVVNRPGLDRAHVVVDAEGYRQRREDTLATMAQRLGKKALEEGKIITFEPMSPRDRRIVHLALAKFPGVVTKSDGEGEGRRVQIIPVRR